MKCPYCCTIVDDNQRRCPICNADLIGYAPSPCDVIPDENDHCAIHDRYEPTDAHTTAEIENARQEYYRHHPKVKELAEGNPKFEAFVDKKLQAETEEKASENGMTKEEAFKKLAEHPVAGFFLALFFVILIVAWTANDGGLAPFLTIVLLIMGITSLRLARKHK